MLTQSPFSDSRVDRVTLPAGPVPLMPNRLWYRAARLLWPQADSSIAWAIVTDAGTPKRCWAATAPGATRLMNACWFRVPGVAYCFREELEDDGDAARAGLTDWDGLTGAGARCAGGVSEFGRGSALAAGWPRS